MMKLTPEDVRVIRQFLGLTQLQFAQRIGVTESFVCHVERGTKKIPDGMDSKIANALGMSVEIIKEITKLRHTIAV